MQQLCYAIQERGKKRQKTPRFILVHPFSRAISSLFANKQRNSLNNHQDKSNPIQLHLHQGRTHCTLQNTTTTSHRSYKTVQNRAVQIQATHPMQFVIQPHNCKPQNLSICNQNHSKYKRNKTRNASTHETLISRAMQKT